MSGSSTLKRGIIPALQTPFDRLGGVDLASLRRLVSEVIDGGASGLLSPVVASEVDHLSGLERERIVRTIAEANSGRLPFIVGASSPNPGICRENGRLAVEVGASAWLVAVPQQLYAVPDAVVPFFENAAAGIDLPLVIQDLDFSGPGLPLETVIELREAVPSVTGIKIETVPAGPKFTQVREACGAGFFIAGGWAIPQMIEALDRGVDGLIPEGSMVRVYSRIEAAYRRGDRGRTLGWFRRLAPVLAFSNQDLGTSIALFKRLLVRKGVFSSDVMRQPFQWDAFRLRIADELIEYYLALEAEMPD